MTEKDGYEMLVARMKALESIAIRYMSFHNTDICTYFELKELLEQEVEKLAGWRN